MLLSEKDQTTDEAYAKGYRAPSRLRQDIKDAHRTRLSTTVLCALLDHFVAGTAASASAWLITHHLLISPVPVLLAGVIIARQLRALENLVHEASHFNWSRRRRRLNDVAGYLLAAAPTGSRISTYRTGHLLHHGRFGTTSDPDRNRYRELDLESLPRTSVGAFTAGVATRLLRYQLGWLRELRTNALAPVVTVLWSTVVVGGPAALLMGVRSGAIATGVWLFAYLVLLPPLRLVAEADEHVYSDARTVFDATVSNIGWVQRLLFHPHADGYHTVHHMWPGIPHHAVRRVHRLLLAEDTEFARRIRIRNSVLTPSSAVSPTEPGRVPARPRPPSSRVPRDQGVGVAVAVQARQVDQPVVNLTQAESETMWNLSEKAVGVMGRSLSCDLSELSADAPGRLRSALVDFREGTSGSGCLLVTGMLTGELPGTPLVHGTQSLAGHPTNGTLALVAEVLGTLIGYADEKNGELFHDVHPVPGEERRMENSGSIEFDFHTENVHHPLRPDFLGLLGLRQGHDSSVATRVASVRRALPHLSAAEIAVLREARFKSRFPTSFTREALGERPTTTKHRIVFGSPGTEFFRFDSFNTEPVDRVAEKAFAALAEALEEVCVEVVLKPGDLLLLDNHIAAHGRAAFTPRYDGQDRWLRRFYSHNAVPGWARRMMTSERVLPATEDILGVF
ncbi:Fatty acid desaturase [Streptomyces sp. TLI_053]|uniref:fatty acid desaturase n=1 Tax=Streptomyces sp. TLI_053 TaxID=1855352 RepID=UPI0008795DE9|nr:fatty acid desaturase [Streptomyces sp. TLI_053]SDT77300.1 Fatty acid desaturase [Streptomyces sp. TLI_053]